MSPEQTRARYDALQEEDRATSGYLNRSTRDQADVWAQKVYDLLEQVGPLEQQFTKRNSPPLTA